MAIVAILSDIHANYDALQVVLKRSEELGVNHYFILGDTVGYYYDNAKVIERIADLPATVVGGNHERMFIDGFKSKSARVAYKQKYSSSLDLAHETLSAAHVEWIENLVACAQVNKYDNVFGVYHGAPWDSDAYIYPDASKSMFDACFDANVHFTLTGHTHYSLLKRISASQTLINPGSVGQPRDVSCFASWCTVSLYDKSISFHRTPYCSDRILKQCEYFDPEKPYLREVLMR